MPAYRTVHQPDFDIYVDGSLTGVTPRTALVREWLQDNAEIEPWQWLGPTLYGDRRVMAELIDGLMDAGFAGEE